MFKVVPSGRKRGEGWEIYRIPTNFCDCYIPKKRSSVYQFSELILWEEVSFLLSEIRVQCSLTWAWIVRSSGRKDFNPRIILSCLFLKSLKGSFEVANLHFLNSSNSNVLEGNHCALWVLSHSAGRISPSMPTRLIFHSNNAVWQFETGGGGVFTLRWRSWVWLSNDVWRTFYCSWESPGQWFRTVRRLPVDLPPLLLLLLSRFTARAAIVQLEQPCSCQKKKKNRVPTLDPNWTRPSSSS